MPDLVHTASQESGWVAALLVLLVVTGFGTLGFLVRQVWLDHRELSLFVRSELVRTIDQNSRALAGLGRALKRRPCLRRDRNVAATAHDTEDQLV